MIEPVVKDVWVSASPERAFDQFTRGLNRWWPRDTHSVGQADCAEVVFEAAHGGRVYERDNAGTEHEWGVIRAWDPPKRVIFSWHPGKSEDLATEVEVTFRAERDGCAVRLEHRGWDVLGEAASETRDGYDGGWTSVLGQYVDRLDSHR